MKCETCDGRGWLPYCCGEMVPATFMQPPECCGRKEEVDCDECFGTGELAHVRFRRQAGGAWEPWTPPMNPKPPTEADAPFKPCYHLHPGCMQWNSVHFVAIRFGDREWTADGWRT